MEEVKNHTVLYICIGVGSVILLIIVIVVILLIKRSKRWDEEDYEPVVYQKSGEIVGLFGSFNGQHFVLSPGMVCTIGRSSSSDICILHKKVSRCHCKIEYLSSGDYRVTDYSHNGTFYKNQPLPKGTPCMLPGQSILAIGTADNVIELQ